MSPALWELVACSAKCEIWGEAEQRDKVLCDHRGEKNIPTRATCGGRLGKGTDFKGESARRGQGQELRSEVASVKA